MSCLPKHGKIDCTQCFALGKRAAFGKTWEEAPDGLWRILSSPLAWGSVEPKILVLGFSKGSKQVDELVKAIQDDKDDFDNVAFIGWRRQVGEILVHVNVICKPPDGDFVGKVKQLIADKNGCFHFGSLVRCAVELRSADGDWTGEHGNLADFTKTKFGMKVARKCTSEFLGSLPRKTKLVIVFGNSPAYIRAVRKLVECARPGNWRKVNEVAYSDGSVTFVHVIHFSARFHHANWLGAKEGTSKKKGVLAREAVKEALAR